MESHRRTSEDFMDELEGLVAVGGDLQPGTLLSAYRQGIFPWPMEGGPLPWFSPLRRAILDFKNLHLSRSLARDWKRVMRDATYRFTLNTAFGEVIRNCANAPRPGQDGTWITDDVIQGYCALHREGHAFSIEAWEGTALVGGLYGVNIDGAVAAESMFHRQTNVSKFCILYLIEVLKQRGLDWIDIQVMTPHMEALGAKLIPRRQFLARLAETRKRGLRPLSE